MLPKSMRYTAIAASIALVFGVGYYFLQHENEPINLAEQDTYQDPVLAQQEAEKAVERISADGFRSIIINSDSMTFGQGHANKLAKHLNASCFLIDGLNADHLIAAVRNELKN